VDAAAKPRRPAPLRLARNRVGHSEPAFRRIEIVVAEAAQPDYALARLTGFLGQTQELR
jgi:hypothetical protein